MSDPIIQFPLFPYGSITVEVERLHAFQTAVMAEMASFNTAVMDAAAAMADTAVNFRGGGLAEGDTFAAAYQQCAQALMQNFVPDAGQGLITLATAAQLAGNKYQAGDATSASILQTVNEAFTPPPTDWAAVERLADHQERQEAAAQAEARERVSDQVAAQWLQNHLREMIGLDQAGQDTGLPDMPSSDYSDPQGDPYRDVAGEGTSVEIPIANDQQQVAEVPMPDGGNALSDFDPTRSFESYPEDVQDEVRDQQPWRDE